MRWKKNESIDIPKIIRAACGLNKPQFAVKRGRILTTFQHALAAYDYWKSTLGATLLERSSVTGRWVRAL